MKVLIIGGNSLLGKYLLLTKPHGYEVEATWYTNYLANMHQMDVGNRSQIRYVMDKIKPELIIHCAAIGSVDYAETNYSEVHAVNVKGTENIIRAAETYNSKFIYISSNAVYEGTNPPYSEKSPLKPVNSYGLIKQQAEEVVKQSSLDYLIIRPFMLYGWNSPGARGNWATYLIHTLGGNQSTKLVNDVIWQPTYAQDCAWAIWQLSKESRQIYNIASPESMSLYEFGLKIAEVWNFDKKLLTPVSSSQFPNMAKRPKNTSYDLRKLDMAGLVLSKVEDGLKKMREDNAH